VDYVEQPVDYGDGPVDSAVEKVNPVSPMIKYTLARLGLFGVVAAVLIALPLGIQLFLRLAIAILISATVSYFALRGLRDEVAEQLAAAARRRAERKRQLRAALAGEDAPEQ
jgi:hypothetical protein